MHRAVKAQLRSAATVGAFMSGGLDSSAVAVTALPELEAAGAGLPVFTWIPEAGWDGRVEQHRYGDESPYVIAIAAQHPGIELNFVTAGGLGHYHFFDEFIAAAEVAPRTALNLCWLHAIHAQARSRGITTLLSGGLGNFTLSGSGAGVCAELWRQGRPVALGRELVAAGTMPFDILRRVWRELIEPLGPDWLGEFGARMRGRGVGEPLWRRYTAVNPSCFQQMSVNEDAGALGLDLMAGPVKDFGAFRRRLFNEGPILEIGDAAQGLRALHGIEMRDPMADRRIVEWSLGVPETQFRRNGVSRWLIRRMMRGLLPHSVLTNPMRGRQLVDWHCRMSRDLPRMKRELKSFAVDPTTSRLIDVARLQTELAQWPLQTITDRTDDRSFFLPVNVPLALAAGRFARWVNGANDMVLDDRA